MFGQISFHSKLNSTKVAAVFSSAFIMGSLLVVFQGRSVTEHRWAKRAGDYLPMMGSSDMSVQTGLSSKF